MLLMTVSTNIYPAEINRTVKHYSLHSIAHGHTMLQQHFYCASSLKLMNMLRICFRSCKHVLSEQGNTLTCVDSAELEMTVSLLIQIDKLVQLLESTVFTCMF